MSRGFRGVWDRLTGKYAHIRRQNELETWQCYLRDRTQMDMLIERQLDERRDLQREITHVRNIHAKEMTQLHRDVAHYMRLGAQEPPLMQNQFREAARPRDRVASRSRGHDMEPSP